MAEETASTPPLSLPSTQSEVSQGRLAEQLQPRDDTTRYLALGGYIFFGLSALAFSTTFYFLFTRRIDINLLPGTAPNEIFLVFLSASLPQVLSLLSALITALIGYALLRSAGTSRREVHPTPRCAIVVPAAVREKRRGPHELRKARQSFGLRGRLYQAWHRRAPTGDDWADNLLCSARARYEHQRG